MQPIPDLIDNQTHQLGEVLHQILEQADKPQLDVVTAFFNLGALERLQPVLGKLTQLRLLLGKEQEQAFVVGEWLRAELEARTTKAETNAQQLEQWRQFLAQAHIHIKRYQQGFCHGKAYLVSGVPMLDKVGIVGSSNFTSAGLTTNRELNAVLKQTSAVADLQRWFEAMWQDADDYKQDLLALLEAFTHLYTPYEIYIKVLYEAIKDKLLEGELKEKEGQPSPIALADFQHDGYLAAKEILENYGGVLIADSVGLGKTYLALRLLDDYAYRERQTALVICPAAVQETVWRPRLREHAIPHEILSMEKVSQKDFPVEEYAQRFRVIVVDESHNFRSPQANRWENLYKLITQGEPDKKVILLTATPVNNSVFDLYHQLQFITRGDPKRLQGVGIPHLDDYFRRAEQNQEALYEVLEALAVRRSRPFIRDHYPNAQIDGQTIRFPERELHTVSYSLKEAYGAALYQQLAEAIERLHLAPYQVESYRQELKEARQRKAQQLALFENPEIKEKLIEILQERRGWSQDKAHKFLMELGRQTGLVGIMRVLYLKRLESSVEALKVSLCRLQRFLQRFLEALNQGRLLTSTEFRKWQQMEQTDDMAEEEVDTEAFLSTLPELNPALYDIESLRRDVETDLCTVDRLLTQIDAIGSDTKLQALQQLLDSSELQGKKIVIFSYFKDTARYLYQRLSVGRNRIAVVDSTVKPEERSRLIAQFAPRANRQEHLSPQEELNLLISTDVLSEGQNLQDAEVLINYDLHWNPVRMVQRVGRIDRIGSPHSVIKVYNFFPEEELEELLGLVNKIREKLSAINRTVGLDASVLGEMPNPMVFNTLRRIAQEDAQTLRELESEAEVAVGEFLKQDLFRFLKALGEERLQHIPLGVGTVRKSADGTTGFFAAFRNPLTNQHHWLFWNEQTDRIATQRLEAIKPVRCGSEEQPLPLPEGFDPIPYIHKLRRHLWNQIRSAQLRPTSMRPPQSLVVNWLRSLAPSADRNSLLHYFEQAPLSGPDLKALRQLWQKRTAFQPEELIQELKRFAQAHPHASTSEPTEITPQREEDLECIAWMLVTVS